MDQETRAKHMGAIRRMVLERRQGIKKAPPDPIIINSEGKVIEGELDESNAKLMEIVQAVRKMTPERGQGIEKALPDPPLLPEEEVGDEAPSETQRTSTVEYNNEMPRRESRCITFDVPGANIDTVEMLKNTDHLYRSEHPRNQYSTSKEHTFVQRTKNGIKVVLRIIATILVPLIAFNLIERLPIIFPLCPFWTYDGEDVLGMVGAGFVAGITFVGLTYSIAPKWKLPFTIVMSSILTALLLLSVIFWFYALRISAINWVHFAQNITAISGLVLAMIGISVECHKK